MARSHARTQEKTGSSEGRPSGVFRQGEAGARVGLYARVSTHDQQTLPLQLSAMREHAERRGWAVVMTAEDIGSGAGLGPSHSSAPALTRINRLSGNALSRNP